MNILLAASEVAPFAKTGGLADVAGALPRELYRMGHDVRIFMPLYRTVRDKDFGLCPPGRIAAFGDRARQPMRDACGRETCRVFRSIFLEQDEFF